MSKIELYELQPSGLDLFKDSESYLNELSEVEIASVNGGRRWRTVVINIGNISINTIVTIVTNTINANTITNANSAV